MTTTDPAPSTSDTHEAGHGIGLPENTTPQSAQTPLWRIITDRGVQQWRRIPARLRTRPVLYAGAALVIAVCATVAVIVRLADDGLNPTSSQTQLQSAAESCAATNYYGGDISDGGHTLFFDMEGAKNMDARGDVQGLACVLGRLGAPTYVTTHMNQTRALDGRQSDSWGDFEASWTYHPDQGLDVLIRER